jgi:hypothetical protein
MVAVIRALTVMFVTVLLYIVVVQGATIDQQRVLIRDMSKSPACMIDPSVLPKDNRGTVDPLEPREF